MPKLLRSVYAGGYSDEKKRKLQSVKLPPKIKCAVCHKTKAVNFFSTIQQLELQNGMATGQVKDPAVEGWVACVSCTPKQVTELECCICEEVKGLDGFAKAQRRLGENARCITCVAVLNGETPIEGGYSKHLIDILGDDDDDSDSEYSTSNAHESSTFSDSESNAGIHVSSGSGYDLENEDLSSLSFVSNDNYSKPSASRGSMKASATPTKRLRVPAGRTGKWQDFSKENGGEPVESTNRAEFTGFDPNGKAHQMFRPGSTVDSDDSSNSTIADPREQAKRDKQERDARSKFAKIPGGRAAPVVIPSYVGGKTVPDHKPDYDDADEDEDWGTI